MPLLFAPTQAWEPLPATAWDAGAAGHLLRRVGWTASPAEISRATREGLPATLDRLFPTQPSTFAEPTLVHHLRQETPELARGVKNAPAGPEKRRLQREARERTQLAIQDMSIKWLQFAAQPANAAFAKWVLFLSDIYVVAVDKVKNAALIYEHFDILSRHALGSAPTLAKAISRSPAMVDYLDLNQSKRSAPNENFARELFELFLLGEGNYTEHDIKESARAFTGYRQQFGAFRFVPGQHDSTSKTIFGKSGRFTGDDVIDLAFQQPAAGAFVPHEMVKFYLSGTPLPPDYLLELGGWWRTKDYDLRALALRFFGSRLFYAAEFRGDFIKSPIQFYLGLVQDLDLSVAPLPRRVLIPLRQMGQMLFNPPNVRGWVGGRSWINSATLEVRRQLVESLFSPLNERTLNADEQLELVAARTNGINNFTVTDELLAPLAALDSTAATQRLLVDYLALPVAPEFRDCVRHFLASDQSDEPQKLRRLRRAAVTLLQSPEYQLC
ncbi:MAG: DUF1800 domain-containing protein [Opitutaceae bacterium]